MLGPAPSEPSQPDVPSASVAAIFRPTDAGTELLFIQRATRQSDPWSGQMAFPGGRTEEVDATFAATAERETHEEIGLDLKQAGAKELGALSPLDGGRAVNKLTLVTAHAYWLDKTPTSITPNEEVADVVWVPVDELANPSRYIDYVYPGNGMTFPGVQLDRSDQVVWGLTLRFLGDLFQRLEHPFIV